MQDAPLGGAVAPEGPREVAAPDAASRPAGGRQKERELFPPEGPAAGEWRATRAGSGAESGALLHSLLRFGPRERETSWWLLARAKRWVGASVAWGLPG